MAFSVAGEATGPAGRNVAFVARIQTALRGYISGDVEFAALRQTLGRETSGFASSIAYGTLGQAAIPVPVVGALVGLSVGYFVGTAIHDAGLAQLGSKYGNEFEEERCQRIEDFCRELVDIARISRARLETQLEEHFGKRRERFAEAFQQLDVALLAGARGESITKLTAICNEFGKTVPYTRFQPFDAMMRAPDRAIL